MGSTPKSILQLFCKTFIFLDKNVGINSHLTGQRYALKIDGRWAADKHSRKHRFQRSPFVHTHSNWNIWSATRMRSTFIHVSVFYHYILYNFSRSSVMFFLIWNVHMEYTCKTRTWWEMVSWNDQYRLQGNESTLVSLFLWKTRPGKRRLFITPKLLNIIALLPLRQPIKRLHILKHKDTIHCISRYQNHGVHISVRLLY